MKTTSYKISKQLAEARFESWANFFWCELGEDLVGIHLSQLHVVPQSVKRIVAYDLETILEALPKQHDFSRGIGMYELRIWYNEGKAFIGYQNFDGFDKVMTLEQEQNESLADIAARLWLRLKECSLRRV